MNTVTRPEIKEELVRKIKLTFPQTVMMGTAESIEYVIQWAIDEKAKMRLKAR